jgi:two-component system, sensor histidine kinase and response regulator
MSKIFDHEGSLLRMGNDHELFHEMVQLLHADAPPLLASLQSAHQEGDFQRLHRTAHTLKGLAANFGAERAVTSASEVEKLAKARQSAGLPAAIAKLEESLDELAAALAPTLEESRSHS